MMDELQRERQRQRLGKLQQQTKKKREAARAKRMEIWMEAWRLSRQDEREAPLYEVLADSFNLTAPSFAPVRSRLVIHVRSVIAKLEDDVSRPWQLPGLQKRLDRAREILNILAPDPHRHCTACGKLFLPGRRDAVTCSSACRQREYRKRVTSKAAQEANP